jgi:hypothetical protein
MTLLDRGIPFEDSAEIVEEHRRHVSGADLDHEAQVEDESTRRTEGDATLGLSDGRETRVIRPMHKLRKGFRDTSFSVSASPSSHCQTEGPQPTDSRFLNPAHSTRLFVRGSRRRCPPFRTHIQHPSH